MEWVFQKRAVSRSDWIGYSVFLFLNIFVYNGFIDTCTKDLSILMSGIVNS